MRFFYLALALAASLSYSNSGSAEGPSEMPLPPPPSMEQQDTPPPSEPGLQQVHPDSGAKHPEEIPVMKRIDGTITPSPQGGAERPKVREVKPEGPTPTPTPTPIPEVIPATISTTPGSVQKIYVIITSHTIDKKDVLKALKVLKPQFEAKFLVVEHKATREIPSHVGADGKLSFDDFANSVRKKYAFKADERLLFLFEGDLLRTDGTPVLFSVTASDLGISVLSLKLIKSNPEKVHERLLKQLRTIAGLFYATPSTCGLMKNAVSLEDLDSMEPDYCPEDKASFRLLKLLR